MLCVIFIVCAVALDVAIIGAGATGSSAAWWLRQLQPGLNIDVYERRQHAGGRVFLEKNVFGVDVEVGASHLVEENRYMSEWVRRFNLTVVPTRTKTESIAINDGTDVVFVNSLRKWSDVHMLWRYGARPLYWLYKYITGVMDNFASIYASQDKGTFYRSAERLWASMGLFEEATKNCANLVEAATGQDSDSPIVNEIVGGSSRDAYSQKLKAINALSCSMSVMPLVSSKTYRVAGGNKQVFERALEDAAVNVHYHTYVTSIKQTNFGGFELDFKRARTGCGPRGGMPHTNRSFWDAAKPENDTNNGTNTSLWQLKRAYDAVLIATPRFFDDVAQFDIHVKDKVTSTRPRRVYEHVFATFTCGTLRRHRPGQELTTVFFTARANSTVHSLTREGVCDNGNPLWKLKSSAKLAVEDIDRYLHRGNFSEVREFQWYAYPKFDRIVFPKLELAPGLFYPSAAEAATSSMEASAMSGRNAALLLDDFLRNQQARKDPTMVPIIS